MEPKTTNNYSEFVSENGMDLEIRGESFEAPIRQTENQQFYTRVSVINIASGLAINELFFLKENDMDGLKDLVSGVKKMPQYLKEKI